MGIVKTQINEQRTIISIDGRLVAARNATISIEDWGFRYGWGAFETIRVSQRKPVFLSRHLGRFAETARALLLSEKDESDWWRRAILKMLARADADERVLNLYWTRGHAPNFHGRRIICLRPLPPRRRTDGRVWVAPWPLGPGVPGVGAKTLAYLPYTFSGFCAQAAGFTDAVLVNQNGFIADGASASVFLISQGRLFTAPFTEGALPGITRSVVIEQAENLGIPVRMAPLPVDRLHTAAGLFLTSVLRGLRRVNKVDDRKLTMSLEAMRVFSRLNRAYEQAVADDLAGYGT